jgi:hypothetical protein
MVSMVPCRGFDGEQEEHLATLLFSEGGEEIPTDADGTAGYAP